MTSDEVRSTFKRPFTFVILLFFYILFLCFLVPIQVVKVNGSKLNLGDNNQNTSVLSSHLAPCVMVSHV